MKSKEPLLTCDAFKKCRQCVNSTQSFSDIITCHIELDLDKCGIQRYNGEIPCGGKKFISWLMRGTVYCVDCLHHSENSIFENQRHTYEERFRCDLVIDEVTKIPLACKELRGDDFSCGRKGREYKEIIKEES